MNGVKWKIWRTREKLVEWKRKFYCIFMHSLTTKGKYKKGNVGVILFLAVVTESREVNAGEKEFREIFIYLRNIITENSGVTIEFVSFLRRK